MDDTAEDWTTPGAFEVAPGVHRIPLPLPGDGLRAVNVYAIEADDGLTLIDGGWALTAALHGLETALGSLGHDLGEVSRFLVTHAHRDHYTLASVVRRMFGARVLLGEHERDNLQCVRDELEDRLPVLEIDRLERYGAPVLAHRLRQQPWEVLDEEIWSDPDGWLVHGEALTIGPRTLEVRHTPGHTRGHVVFVDHDTQLLFAGDHILPHITPSIGFEGARPARPLADYLRSLRSLIELRDLRVLPAHGPPAPSVHTRSRELLAHHERRLEATHGVLRAGTMSAFEVAARLTWTRRERVFEQLDDFNQMLAISETAAHLDVLVDRGLATVDDRGHVTRYARTD